MNKFENEVQGVALYLEFRKPYATCQVIITPDGFTKTRGVTNSVFFRRTISNGATKKKWRNYSMVNTAELRDALQYGNEVTTSVLDDKTMNRIENLSDYFASLVRGGYKMVNDTPIYVEITKDDLEAVSAGNLPPKLWGRIKATRAFYGFPEEVITTA